MPVEQRVIDELTTLVNESEDKPYAIVAFVIRDDEDAQSVKVLAAMPPNSAKTVRAIVSEAMDTVVDEQEAPDLPTDVDFRDRMAISLCGCRYDELSERIIALWEFNEDALQLFDSLVSSDLARDGITDWYWQFRAFLTDTPYDVTPELRRFLQRGPNQSGQELASMIFLALTTLVDIDPNDPPSSVDEDSSDEAAGHVADFIEHAIKKMVTH